MIHTVDLFAKLAATAKSVSLSLSLCVFQRAFNVESG
jgi:hypothetical protein